MVEVVAMLEVEVNQDVAVQAVEGDGREDEELEGDQAVFDEEVPHECFQTAV